MSANDKNITVNFFFRKPLSFHKSIEQVFGDIIAHLPSKFKAQKIVMHHYSKGLWNRLKIIFQSFLSQADVNHVTGDIHFATLLMQKNKTILTIHDCRLLDEWHGFKYRIFRFFWFELPVKRCRYVTVISGFTFNRLKHHIQIDNQKIRVIPVAIDQRYQSLPKEFNGLKPIVLQVGTMINKNLPRTIEALSGISCHLRIIGGLKKEDLILLKKYDIDYSNITGISSDEMIQEYKNADMLVFASTYEGFGLPILEAQATGRPVVTSNVASMPEIAGDAACLVDPFSTESIRSGILKIIEDHLYRDELVQNGFKNVQRYQLSNVVNMYTELYESIATQN